MNEFKNLVITLPTEIAKDYKSDLIKHSKLAMKGNSDSQYALHNMYKYGLGVKKNLKTSSYWLNKANTNKLIKDAKEYVKNLEG